MTALNAEIQERFDLPLEEAAARLAPSCGACALEDETFPFEEISTIAEVESWRKEINRPIYHIHKWWAQRLGSVFRAITIGALTPSGTDIMRQFYRPVRLRGVVVYDPFMGSGTTVGEAVKLGARAIGRDINPVAHFLVKNALAFHDRRAVLATYAEIEKDVSARVRRYYRTTLPDGTTADVLYYFWVKVVPCPKCTRDVDLFSSRVFARHAYAKRYPDARATCPSCREINTVRYDAAETTCASCDTKYNPQVGPAQGQKASCPCCDHTFQIAKQVREQDQPPAHRLYAKLVLRSDGTKSYERATDSDHALFASAAHELTERKDSYPVVPIEPGYNTSQAIGYNYRFWHQMFNERQLLCLSILAERISQVSDPIQRDLFACLFSGCLEFNNLFTSYKGEGTGAVRHMFAHHILKPERVPLEANLWGTPKSSGSFSTMFEGRIRRALDYADDPFELRVTQGPGRALAEKVYGISEKIGVEVAETYADFGTSRKGVYLSCGDSSRTDIPDASVDAVITDPPFFDNVHYSQLADFFHVWQRHILGDDGSRRHNTTRSLAEVQNADAEAFTVKLSGVLQEACRVLRQNGILAFTYHHSRSDGWRSVLRALIDAGFQITAAHPIKAEMSVAMPKHQAKEPIDLDVILVCRKRTGLTQQPWKAEFGNMAVATAGAQIRRLCASGRRLSRNDVRVIVMAQFLRHLSGSIATETAIETLDSHAAEIEAAIDALHCENTRKIKKGEQ